MTPPNKIVLIGAGNVATHLGVALKEKGYPILQVYSHTLASTEALGKQLNVPYTNDLASIVPDADVYIFSIKDSALPDVLKAFPVKQGLFVHTAGSLPMSVFEGYADRYGVLYPLQTFSKDRPVNFKEIPLFIEANSAADLHLLNEIASSLSSKVYPLSSEKRKSLHLAAVFACNFVNYLYTIAFNIVEEEGMLGDVLLPLIRETVNKIEAMTPRDAQTGPAIRADENVMNMHRAMLKGKPGLLELYNLISKEIGANLSSDTQGNNRPNHPNKPPL
jgi:NADP oxidoreductase coenzyme F420-dependent./Domain of unknown function (DUF2520).